MTFLVQLADLRPLPSVGEGDGRDLGIRSLRPGPGRHRPPSHVLREIARDRDSSRVDLLDEDDL